MRILVFTIVVIFSVCCGNGGSARFEIDKDHAILGKWKLVSSTRVPFDVESFCDGIEVGAFFIFNKNNTIDIRKKNLRNCNDGQVFWIEKVDSLSNPISSDIDSQLVLFEYDLGMSLDLVELNQDTLILDSRGLWRFHDREIVINRKMMYSGESDLSRMIFERVENSD